MPRSRSDRPDHLDEMSNTAPSAFRYVADVNPPTLEQAWDAFCEKTGLTPGQIVSAMGHHDRTIRERLRGERYMSLVFLLRWCAFVGMDIEEAMARDLARLSPDEIGNLERIRAEVRALNKSPASLDYYIVPPEPGDDAPSLVGVDTELFGAHHLADEGYVKIPREAAELLAPMMWGRPLDSPGACGEKI